MAKRKLADYEGDERDQKASRTKSRSAVQDVNEGKIAGATQREPQPVEVLVYRNKTAKLITALDSILENTGVEGFDEEMISQCVKLRNSLNEPSNTHPPAETPSNIPTHPYSTIESLRNAVGSLASLTPWTKSSIPPLGATPPPPRIKDPAFEKATFTHGGTITNDNPSSYERLEWLGDAYIYILSTHFIYHTFTSNTPGRMAQMRERIVKNETLASYAHAYNWHKSVLLPPDVGKLKYDHPKLIKVFGDVFEAYVGAVILSDPEHGLADVAAWLKTLWASSLSSDIIAQERRNTAQVVVSDHRKTASDLSSTAQIITSSTSLLAKASTANPGNSPKEILSKMIGFKGVKLYYKDCAPEKTDRHTGLTLFTVGLYLDDSNEDGVVGKQLSFGSGLSKKDAGQKAAEAMLANKKMMKVYEERKNRFDEMFRKQKQVEA